jgi:hypothetical protein
VKWAEVFKTLRREQKVTEYYHVVESEKGTNRKPHHRMSAVAVKVQEDEACSKQSGFELGHFCDSTKVAEIMISTSA